MQLSVERSQAVQKALGLMVDAKSLSSHYDLVRDRLLANSSSFVKTVLRESEPRLGKDASPHHDLSFRSVSTGPVEAPPAGSAGV